MAFVKRQLESFDNKVEISSDCMIKRHLFFDVIIDCSTIALETMVNICT